jgi:pyrimidine operon attenuation protein/uracil phosphoribosyltransferase
MTGKIDGQKLQDGLAKLVLALVRILLDVMERQAFRRAEFGSLKQEEVERLGRALMDIRQRFEEVSNKFGFETKDLDLPLRELDTKTAHDSLDNSSAVPANTTRSQLGLTSESLVNVIDLLIEKRTILAGEVTLSLAGIDLVVLHLLATLQPVTASPSSESFTSKRFPSTIKYKGQREK